MILFDYVIEHWFISLLATGYVLLACILGYSNLLWVLNCGKDSNYLRWREFLKVRRGSEPWPIFIGDISLSVVLLSAFTAVMFVIRTILFTVMVLPVPVFWYWIQKSKRKQAIAQAVKKEEDKKLAERQKQQQQKYAEEQNRRLEARKDWFTNNTVKLYYNTISGVTAVLREADYHAVQKKTADSRLDGYWDRDNLLMISEKTFIFVNKQGSETIQSTMGDTGTRYKVAGLLSKLHNIVENSSAELEHSRVELIRDEAIFVPGVSEAVYSYKDQLNHLKDLFHYGTTGELITKQLPTNIQPLSK